MRSLRLRDLAAAATRYLPSPARADERWQHSFRAHVIALVIAGALPLAGLGFYSMRRLAAAERAADQAEIVGTTRAVASTIEQQFRYYFMNLRALAKRLPHDPSRMGDFYDDCAALAAESGGWILLADSGGEQVFNTKRSLGAKLPPVSGSREFAEAIATGQPGISNLLIATIDPQPQFTIYQPIVEEGGVSRVLARTFPARSLNTLLRAQHLPEAWMVAVIDRTGTIVARPDDTAPVRPRREAAQLGDGLDAFLLRHDDVGDDEVGALGAEGRHAALAVLGAQHAVAAILQDLGEGLAHDDVIVDYQDLCHRLSRCGGFGRCRPGAAAAARAPRKDEAEINRKRLRNGQRCARNNCTIACAAAEE
jgi:hypothetical protein